jgi:hypothetical protein
MNKYIKQKLFGVVFSKFGNDFNEYIKLRELEKEYYHTTGKVLFE